MNTATTATDNPQQDDLRRKALVPLWIRVFGWLYMGVGLAGAFYFIAAATVGHTTTYNFYGVVYEVGVLAPIPMLILSFLMAGGVAAFGLLYGKRWGLAACFTYGYFLLASFVACVIIGYDISLLRVIVLILFLRSLHKLRAAW